ncbi:MAG TPA: DegT/DnrJ/EryC1/StrS family aminotransferase [Gemmatimonadales bacterium]|nr:DegT/DnrJ/EryC1/StrS family aminotransferase [Gemmatimonadales bacterium]
MRVPLLDLTAQYKATKDAVLPALMSVIERQQFIMGPEVPALEADIARLCHTRHAIGCASGTDALLLPLMALDLKPGDEIICPAFTFFATAGTVHNTGGTPVFVDIDPATFNVTAATIEPAITNRTRAIIVVHLFGQMVEMERILALAAKHGIPVIEDAAQSIGARRSMDGEWRLAGETGWMGSFSFFPSKNLGAYGDAGMMVCQSDTLADRLKRLRLHGGARQYHHDEVGTNSRLDTLQAAALHAKLPFLAGWSEARRQNAARYAEGLAGLSQVTTPATDTANEHIFHQYTLRVERRDALQQFLKERDIGSAVYYPLPLHLQPCFAYLGYQPGRLPVTEDAASQVLSLPIYPELSRAQLDWVVESIRAFYA